MKKRALVFNIVSISVFVLSGIIILAYALLIVTEERHDPDMLIGSSAPISVLFGILPTAALEISLYRALGYFICKDKAEKSIYKSAVYFVMAAVCIAVAAVGILTAVSEVFHLQFFWVEWAKDHITYLVYRFAWIPALLLIMTNLMTI